MAKAKRDSQKKSGGSRLQAVTAGLIDAAHPALVDAKRSAVIGCVNAFMDQKRPGWNGDLHGDTRKMGDDYHFPPQSMPVVLGAIRDCLRAKHYTFTITDDLVRTCAAGTLADMKYAIYQATNVT